MVVNVFISAVTKDNLSRKDAVAWVNDKLKSHLTKVEEMSTGACYCQLTHYLFNDGINLRKVKFNPRNEPEVLSNWKTLTTAWKLLGVDKPVEVERLMKGKFQDNMEFLQWFYKFFNANLSAECEDYDAVAARNGEDLPALSKGAAPRPPVKKTSPPLVKKSSTVVVEKARPAPPLAENIRPVAAPTANVASNETKEKALKKMKEEVEELQKRVDETAVERDFYYEKCRKIEELMNVVEETEGSSQLTSDVKAILYDAPPEEEVEVDSDMF